MEELDVKDKKILMQLTKNSRQSLTQIAKQVGLTKDFVFYRIKKLENIGIIKKYLTQIDTLKIGFIGCRFYYKFQYTTPQLKNEIIEYFISHQRLQREETYFAPCSNDEIIIQLADTLIMSYERLGFYEKAEKYKLLLETLKQIH